MRRIAALAVAAAIGIGGSTLLREDPKPTEHVGPWACLAADTVDKGVCVYDIFPETLPIPDLPDRP